MGKFSKILLTVDYDRTLTAPDSTIPEKNLEAIRYFMEEGGAFTVNTGRSLPMVQELKKRVPVNAPLLLYNGSAAYDTEKEKITFMHEIRRDMKQVVTRCMELLPDLTVEVQGLDAHYQFEKNPAWEEFTAKNHCAWKTVSLDTEIKPFLKFTVYGKITEPTVSHLFAGDPKEIARIDEAERILNQEFGSDIVVFRAGTRIIDMHQKGVSKARSARELQHQLGKEILVCVGDGENDITMLDEADFSFCPGDAIVKDRYENVCDCGSGAVAEVIYKKIPEILGISLT